jgi:DNA repair protein RecO
VSLLPQPTGSGRGLVLRRWPAGETSVVVSALIDGCGLMRLLGKGARQPRSRLRSLVEPGRLVDLEFSLYRDRDLQYLRGGGLVLDPLAGAITLERTAYLQSALELVDRCRPGHGHEEGLFPLCQSFVQVLSCADAGREVGLFYAFEIALLGLLGLRPQLEACTRCGVGGPDLVDGVHWLSPAAGGLVCGPCGAHGQVVGARPLSASLLEIWPQLAAAPDLWPNVDLPRPAAREWGIMLHRFLAYHLPGYRLPSALQLLRSRPDREMERPCKEDRA